MLIPKLKKANVIENKNKLDDEDETLSKGDQSSFNSDEGSS